MSFLKNIFGKKETPINSYSDFWDWFLTNEKEFFTVVKNGKNIRSDFFDKLSPKLNEIHEDIYYLTGMFDSEIAELVFTPDGIIKNIYVVEELVNSAPKINNWRFTALKPGTNKLDFSIDYEGRTLDTDNLNFYPNTLKEYPDEIDLSIVYDNYKKEDELLITNAVYIFLDNYLGELNSVTLIDNLKVIRKDDVTEELIPIEKLKDYLIWREKEFVEKYEGIRHNTENDAYANFEGKTKEGAIVLSIMNTTLLEWDKKASHPWIFIVTIPFPDCNNGGLPDNEMYKVLDEIEEEIMRFLPDSDGYLNVGRETSNNTREIFFTCKDFREPPKVLDQLIKKYIDSFEISYEIYKDKYWQLFRNFEGK